MSCRRKTHTGHGCSSAVHPLVEQLYTGAGLAMGMSPAIWNSAVSIIVSSDAYEACSRRQIVLHRKHRCSWQALCNGVAGDSILATLTCCHRRSMCIDVELRGSCETRCNTIE